jgi:hypothetical protein
MRNRQPIQQIQNISRIVQHPPVKNDRADVVLTGTLKNESFWIVAEYSAYGYSRMSLKVSDYRLSIGSVPGGENCNSGFGHDGKGTESIPLGQIWGRPGLRGRWRSR